MNTATPEFRLSVVLLVIDYLIDYIVQNKRVFDSTVQCGV